MTSRVVPAKLDLVRDGPAREARMDDIIFIGSGSEDTYIFGRDGRDEELEVILDNGRWLDADTLEPISLDLSTRLSKLIEGR